MRYTPYTEAQIQSMHCIPEGIYPFMVIDVDTSDKFGSPLVDRNGNDLAKLKLNVLDNDDKNHTIYTFISADGNFAYKLRHFAQSIGQLAEYENGTFQIENTGGCKGMAQVVIKLGVTKIDGSGEKWPDRNDIKDFVSNSGPTANDIAEGFPNQAPISAISASKNQAVNPPNDDIPF